MECPCGSGAALEACCGPFISGDEVPPTPEKLMRSRYTAYATGKVQYVIDTHHPDTSDEIDANAARRWSQEAEWHGLEVVGTSGGSEQDDEGTVEFIATYEMRDKVRSHRERAVFRRHEGRWFFHDGQIVPGQSVVRAEPKVGRNDPCPCGSGKKHKKCCGAAGART